MGFPQAIFKRHQQSSRQAHQFLISEAKQVPYYVAVVGSFVSAAVGYLGVSTVSDEEPLRLIFASILGLIFLAQDGSSLIVRASHLLDEMSNLQREDLWKHKSEAVVLMLSLLLGSATALSPAVIKPAADAILETMGMQDLTTPIKVLLLSLLSHFVLSNILRAGSFATSLCANKYRHRGARDEEIGLIPKVVIDLKMIKHFFDYVMSQLKMFVVDPGNKNPLIKVLSEDSVDLSLLRYYAAGLKFWAVQNDQAKVTKKLDKILTLANPDQKPLENQFHVELDNPVEPTDLKSLKKYYAVGASFWVDRAHREVEMDKKIRCEERARNKAENSRISSYLMS